MLPLSAQNAVTFRSLIQHAKRINTGREGIYACIVCSEENGRDCWWGTAELCNQLGQHLPATNVNSNPLLKSHEHRMTHQQSPSGVISCKPAVDNVRGAEGCCVRIGEVGPPAHRLQTRRVSRPCIPFHSTSARDRTLLAYCVMESPKRKNCVRCAWVYVTPEICPVGILQAEIQTYEIDFSRFKRNRLIVSKGSRYPRTPVYPYYNCTRYSAVVHGVPR